MKTVFFGPFIGEFGWELLYWQGWVRDVSRTFFKNYHKIASSYPGRYPFYPDADEFWPHPDWLSVRTISQRGYISDWWKNGLPLGSSKIVKYKWGILPYYETIPIHPQERSQDAYSPILGLLDSYKKRLPSDAVYFTPFLINKCPKYNITFGAAIPDNPEIESDFTTYRIDSKYQILEKLIPTAKGKEAFLSIDKEKRKIIAVFPRKRDYRRPITNWKEEKYTDLIKMLQRQFRDYTIAILGEPGGTYYTDGVPDGCLDLINVDSNIRMDIQIAALEQTVLAISGMSGAIMFSLACGCPSLTFGFKEQIVRYHQENYLGTRLIYYPFMDAETEEIFRLAQGMISNEIPPANQDSWDSLDYFGVSYKIKKKIASFIQDRIRNFTIK